MSAHGRNRIYVFYLNLLFRIPSMTELVGSVCDRYSHDPKDS